MCSEIEKYRKEIRGYLEDDSAAIFGNYTKEHAACVTELFIESAQSSIEILSGCFPEEFYDTKGLCELLQDAKDRRGVEIRVITLCDETSEKLLQLANMGKIEYRPARASKEPVSHFMIVDNKRYRLEMPHGENPKYVKAEVCCNGSKKANALLKCFNDAWESLRPGA